jgi:membrane protease YdiL (CAAX protease family)
MGFLKNRHNEVWAGWKILIVLVTFFVITLIFTVIFSIVYGVFAVITSGQTDPIALTQNIMNDSLFTSLSGILQNVAMVIPVLVFWKVFDRKPFSDMGLTSFRHGAKDFLYGLALGAVTISAVFVVLLLSGQISVTNDFLSPDFSWMLIVDLILMIFVGFGEEIFSRGYCKSVLEDRILP